MITQEQILDLLLDACPSFREPFNAANAKDMELPYLVSGEFARHLLHLYQANKLDEFPKVAEMIENMHINGDDYVKTFVTIGILEDLQNSWADTVNPEKFSVFLLPVSLKYWHSLNKFWKGETPMVSSDVKKL